MKKILVIIVSAIILIIILISILILSSRKSPKTDIENFPLPTKNPVAFPTSTAIKLGTKDQGQADKNFSEELKRSRAPYPWYKSMPISTNDYFVYFDLEKKTFTGKIYTSKGDVNSERINEIKKEVEIKLTSLRVNLKTYPIEWELW